MSKNSIGGFFVDLGMNVDKASFENGNKYIDGIGNGFLKITGLARNAAVVMATTAIAGGTMSSAELKMASAFGVATEKLDVWRAAAKIAGVSADGLAGSMGQLADMMNHTDIDGRKLEQYAKQLSYLGVNVADLLDMDPASAFQSIFETAQSKIAAGEDKTRILTIVNDVLGSDARGLLSELDRKHMSIRSMLYTASSTQYQTADSKNKGADFSAEVKTLAETAKSLTRLFGDEAGGALLPVVKEINAWLQTNGNEIAETLKATALLVGLGIKTIEPISKKAGKSFMEIMKDSLSGAKAAVSLDGKGFLDSSLKFFSDTALGIIGLFNNMTIDEVKTSAGITWDYVKEQAKNGNIGEAVQAGTMGTGINEQGERKARNFPLQKNKTGINDGIIRPNGQVTQIAPDDWVFAARNISDLAGAFIPHGNTSQNNNQFSIVQNFTVNGARDSAQTIRQQAFNGTKSALQESMNMSGQRLLMMSGTM